MKVNWRLWLGVVISVASLYAAAHNIDLAQVGRSLWQAQVGWVLLAVALVPIGLLFKTYHWQWLFRPSLYPPFGRLLGAFSISYLLTSILPARMGELARPVLLRQWLHIPFARTLSTILAERLLDICILFTFLLALIRTTPLPAGVAASGTALGLAALGGLTLLVGLSRNAPGSLGLFDRIARWSAVRLPFLQRFVAPLRSILAEVLEGVSALGHPTTAVPAISASVIAWLMLVLGTHWNLLAFNLHLPPSAPFLIAVVITFGAVVPAPPAQLGVFEALVIFVLTFYGVDESVALSFAVVYHLVNYGVLTVCGLFGLWYFNLSVKGVAETVSHQQSVVSSQQSAVSPDC